MAFDIARKLLRGVIEQLAENDPLTGADNRPHTDLVMSAIPQFLSAVDAFCLARGISEARASTLILNGGSRIGAIRSGASDIGTRRLAEAMQWLSDHWPENATWPADVARPAVSAPGEAAA
ncbi:hypothetical protein [Methylorubrum extorquens]